METHGKREYSSPRLVEYGRVEDITRGNYSGWFDFLWGSDGSFIPTGGGGSGHTST
jgi:hypothetical protein